jgi:tetratricopeptide (TPR) repeat protein
MLLQCAQVAQVVRAFRSIFIFYILGEGLEKAHESFDKGNYDEGSGHLDVILKDQNFIATLYNKGLLLERLGKHEEAIEYYDKALAIDPDNVGALVGIGASLANSSKYKGSMAYYDKALHKEAIECYDKALAIDPNNVEALNNKGFSLFGLDKYKEAIEYNDKVLAIDPSYINALNNKKAAVSKLKI